MGWCGHRLPKLLLKSEKWREVKVRQKKWQLSGLQSYLTFQQVIPLQKILPEEELTRLSWLFNIISEDTAEENVRLD